MSQVATIEIPSHPPGLTYRTLANARLAAVATHHEGADWPVDPDTCWIAVKTGVSPWQIGIWDGSSWIIIGTVDATANTFVPSGQSNWVAAAIDISSTDLNSLPSSGSGIYRGSSLTNRPGDTDVVYIVQQITVDASNLIQHSWRLTGGGLWTRRRVSGTWSSWTRLDEIADGAVSNAKLANMATLRFKGRKTAGSGPPEDLTAAEAAALLPAFVPDAGSGGTKGLVPTPSAGDLAAGKILGAAGWVAPIGLPTLHLQDRKSQGTDGGGAISGSFNKRTLNTEVTDDRIGSTLASDQFTLPAGTYWADIRVPGYDCNGHQAKLRNVTDGADTLIGSPERSNSNDPSTTWSVIRGRFTIAGTKTFEVQHRIDTSALSANGLAANFTTEIYTDVFITKVG